MCKQGETEPSLSEGMTTPKMNPPFLSSLDLVPAWALVMSWLPGPHRTSTATQ
jgi:hypothetical protein